MPELPEVEAVRLELERVLLGKRITRVIVDAKDRIGFDRAPPNTIKRAIEGAKVEGTGRKGKYFWLKLDRRPWPVFHLGMSGNFQIDENQSGFSRAWIGTHLPPENDKTPAIMAAPRHSRMVIEMDDGTRAAFTDPRRFGRVRLADDPLREAPISKLGVDPLAEFPTDQELYHTLQARKAPIKAVLLDQKVFAGVGNWIADEILFQARISPHRLAKSLNLREVKRIRTRTLSVIKKAVSVKADYRKFPGSWIFHDRWDKGKESHTSRGYLIQYDTVGGRTTAWVPDLQV